MLDRFQLNFSRSQLLTVAALVLSLIGIAVGVYFVKFSRYSPLEADTQKQPQQIKLTNITSNSVTVVWLTEKPSTGLVVYGTSLDQVDNIARDQRDIFNEQQGRYQTHLVKINGLQPNRQYYFYIDSGGYKDDNQGSLYRARTASEIEFQPIQQPARLTGKVVNAANQPAGNTLIILSGEQISPMATLTDERGNWSLSLNKLLDAQLSQQLLLTPEMELILNFYNSPSLHSLVKFKPDPAGKLPLVQLGRNYNLTTLALDNPAVPAGTNFKLIPDLGAQSGDGSEISIWSPEENEVIYTDKPLILGTAPPDAEVTLTIDEDQPQPIQGTVTADEDGEWQWPVPQSLADGEHVITALYTADQVEFVSSRVFQVLANNSAPAFESSPSQQLPPTATPTIPSAPATSTPTPTQAFELSPTPTSTPAPTQAPLASPTATPTPTQVSEISPTPTQVPELPKAGYDLPTWGLTGMGLLLLLGAGLLLI